MKPSTMPCPSFDPMPAKYLAGSGLNVGLTGSASTSVDTNAAYDHAEKIIGIATVILIVVLLGLIFRSPIAAVLPIVVILLIHSVTQGLTASLAKGFGFNVGNSLGPLLIVVLFGVGTDYVIFMLFRYRENLHSGEDYRDALGHATEVIDKVIASSALTVMAAFAALLLASLGSLQTLAPGLIVAVAVMLVAALTLVPALLVLLGKHFFWPAGPGTPAAEPKSARIGHFVAEHPVWLAGGILVVLVGLSMGIINYTSTYNTLGELPSSTESLVAYNTLQSAFPPGALAPTQVMVNGNGPIDPNSLTNLTERLTKANGVSYVAPAQFSADKTAALITVVLSDNPFDQTALDDVEGPIRQAAHGSVPGESVLVGGQTSTLVDVRSSLHHDTNLIIPVAAGIIAVILGLLLLAIVAPLYLIVGVALTYAATLGAGALVFVNGLGYSGIDFSNPIVLYLFVIAIGTDYNILMSDRLREEFQRGRSPRESVRNAITHGAPAVWAAGVILAGTFASLLISGIANLVELGFGVTIGILIAAFLLAPVLVPSISQLQGRSFWWPSRARTRVTAVEDSEHLQGQLGAAAARCPGRRGRPRCAARPGPGRRSVLGRPSLGRHPGPVVRPSSGGRLGCVHDARVLVIVVASLTLELQGAVGNGVRPGDGPLRPLTDHLGLFEGRVSGQDQMGRQRPHLARQAPHVQVMDLGHAVHGDHAGRQRGEIDVRRCRFEEHGRRWIGRRRPPRRR